MDVIPYRLQVMHLEIYLPHPATLTKEDNHHSDYGGQQQIDTLRHLLADKEMHLFRVVEAIGIQDAADSLLVHHLPKVAVDKVEVSRSVERLCASIILCSR